MNKILRYSFVALLAMIGLNISAQEVTKTLILMMVGQLRLLVLRVKVIIGITKTITFSLVNKAHILLFLPLILM